MQSIKIAPTFFIIKNVVEIKNVKKRKKRDINKKRKKRFLHLCSVYCRYSTGSEQCVKLLMHTDNPKILFLVLGKHFPKKYS